MRQHNKIWFNAYSRTLWVPVCWQGWLVIIGFSAAIVLIYLTNHVSENQPFDLAKHWPIFVELAGAFIWINVISRGHINKKY